jgi:para-nitrobenzyl esterase
MVLDFLRLHRAALIAVAALVTGLASPVLAAAPQIKTDNGLMVGRSEDGAMVFRGVPFAQPPIGALRWQPAQPAQPWNGTLKATRFGPACLQKTKMTAAEKAASGSVPSAVSEDCLTLNIWAPAKADQPLPVMVWLHGGSHVSGAGSLPFYDGASFARNGVILVSINYRLGLLGYFAHPALTKAASSDAPLGGYGTTDQLEALRWVQKNIAAFGGDPANVTLFGESAGGMSTLAILTSPSAKGLFAKAIVQSGLGWAAPRTFEKAQSEGVAAAKLLGLDGENATVEQLRAVSGDALIAAAESVKPGLIVDGRLLPQNPSLAFDKGEALAVPLIIGTNSNEGSLIVNNDPANVLSKAAPDLLSASKAFYGPDAATDASLASRLWRDATFAAPARWVARKASARSPAWLYHFDYVPERLRKGSAGTNHGYEIPFVFDSWRAIGPLSLLLTNTDRAQSATVHACWVAFAKTGVPACEGAPAWPAYSVQTDQLMDFAPTNSVKSGFNKPMLDAIEASLTASGLVPAGR